MIASAAKPSRIGLAARDALSPAAPAACRPRPCAFLSARPCASSDLALGRLAALDSPAAAGAAGDVTNAARRGRSCKGVLREQGRASRLRTSSFTTPTMSRPPWPTPRASRCWSISGRPGARLASRNCRRSRHSRPVPGRRASLRSRRTWRRGDRSTPSSTRTSSPTSKSGTIRRWRLSSATGAEVLPTTILYDAEGREVWRYVGDLDWTGEEAAKLLAEAGAAERRLSSRPSIAARPSAIRPRPAKSCAVEQLRRGTAHPAGSRPAARAGSRAKRWSRRRESISRK